jgi:hypothetical protein
MVVTGYCYRVVSYKASHSTATILRSTVLPITFLVSILNENNQTQLEIAKRIPKVNRAYYANAKLLKLKLLKRSIQKL